MICTQLYGFNVFDQNIGDLIWASLNTDIHDANSVYSLRQWLVKLINFLFDVPDTNAISFKTARTRFVCMYVCVCIYVGVCVRMCVKDREEEREKDVQRLWKVFFSCNIYIALFWFVDGTRLWKMSIEMVD